MPYSHIANTFFEQELEIRKKRPFEEQMKANLIHQQLQFLPLLYRQKQEKVLVSHFPSPAYLDFLAKQGLAIDNIQTFSEATAPLELELWGASPAVADWAEGRGIHLDLPDWDRVRVVHSKLFSFDASMQIPGSRILQNIDETKKWIDQTPGPKVLKKAFGLAGSGHLHIDDAFPPEVDRLFEQKNLLIGEPWVNRLFDFSTQWKLSKTDITYIGATVLETSNRGAYLGTRAGDERILFRDHTLALQEHLEIARPVLKKIQELGFFGNLGIDAFVYEWKGDRRLRAISEINARKTMGWVALQIQRFHFPKKILHLSYEKSKAEGFLPTHLGHHPFQRQLLLSAT